MPTYGPWIQPADAWVSGGSTRRSWNDMRNISAGDVNAAMQKAIDADGVSGSSGGSFLLQAEIEGGPSTWYARSYASAVGFTVAAALTQSWAWGRDDPPDAIGYEWESNSAEWLGQARLQFSSANVWGMWQHMSFDEEQAGAPWTDFTNVQYQLRVSSVYDTVSLSSATAFNPAGQVMWSQQSPTMDPPSTYDLGMSYIRTYGPMPQTDITNLVDPETGDVVLIPYAVPQGPLPTSRAYNTSTRGYAKMTAEVGVSYLVRPPRIRYIFADAPPPPPPGDVGRLKVLVGESEGSKVIADFEGGTAGSVMPADLALPPLESWKVSWGSNEGGQAKYSSDSFRGTRSCELPATYFGATLSADLTVAEVGDGIGAYVKVLPGATNKSWADIWFYLGDNSIEILPTQEARSTPHWDNILGYHPTMIAFEYSHLEESEWGFDGNESAWLNKWMDVRMLRTGEWSVRVGGSVILAGQLDVPANLTDADDFGMSVTGLGDGRVLVDNIYTLSTSPWKYADPYPGENGGFGVLKVKINDTGDPEQDWWSGGVSIVL